jgi:hypothetical protein
MRDTIEQIIFSIFAGFCMTCLLALLGFIVHAGIVGI